VPGRTKEYTELFFKVCVCQWKRWCN